jgi:hypothetical protein
MGETTERRGGGPLKRNYRHDISVWDNGEGTGCSGLALTSYSSFAIIAVGAGWGVWCSRCCESRLS